MGEPIEIHTPLPGWTWAHAPGWRDGDHYWIQVDLNGEPLPLHFTSDTNTFTLPWYRTSDHEHTVRAQAWSEGWTAKGLWSEASDPVINLYTQPVPEPGGVLLVAGLVVLAVAAAVRKATDRERGVA